MPKKNYGILITFEGTEGSGKSTLIREVSSSLQSMGVSVTQTREPGGSKLAEQIRNILLTQEMDPQTELFLYEAARAQHWATIIQPGLERGAVVLCDRFTDSTLAYQSHARGLPWKNVQLLNQMATSGYEPQLTVFLDIDPEAGLRRAQDPNRFEAEGVQFQKKVRAGFLKARSENPKRWLTLQVKNKTPEALAEAVIEYLKKRYKSFFPVKKDPKAKGTKTREPQRKAPKKKGT